MNNRSKSISCTNQKKFGGKQLLIEKRVIFAFLDAVTTPTEPITAPASTSTGTGNSIYDILNIYSFNANSHLS